jgi:hypothetical protein
VWIEYNEHILATLKELSANDYIVVNYSLLQEKDQQIFSFLTKAWGFTLQYFPFTEVYKENLISRQVDLGPYFKDQELLARAKSIEEELKRYMVAD